MEMPVRIRTSAKTTKDERYISKIMPNAKVGLSIAMLAEGVGVSLETGWASSWPASADEPAFSPNVIF